MKDYSVQVRVININSLLDSIISLREEDSPNKNQTIIYYPH